MPAVDDEEWIGLFEEVARVAGRSLERHARAGDLTAAGDREGQYRFDVGVDEAVLEILAPTGVPTLSEESGVTGDPRSAEIIVVDPIDGSTNASRGIPHFACSICLMDDYGPRVSLVADLALGERFTARRGHGANLGDQPMTPSGCSDLSEAVVGIAGHPNHPVGWAQFRALGSCALDVSWVACGRLDAFVDPISHHGVWDYAAAHLIAKEAGVASGEMSELPLIHRDHSARRGPIYAATLDLLRALRGEVVG